MTRYDASFENVEIAYPPEKIKNTLGEYISNLGLKQLRIAETEKYAHVTFFFNGGIEEPYPNEMSMKMYEQNIAKAKNIRAVQRTHSLSLKRG